MRIVISSSTGNLLRLGHPIWEPCGKLVSRASRLCSTSPQLRECILLVAKTEACLAASVDTRSLSCRRTLLSIVEPEVKGESKSIINR